MTEKMKILIEKMNGRNCREFAEDIAVGNETAYENMPEIQFLTDNYLMALHLVDCYKSAFGILRDSEGNP
jgi:hypothetical protein